MFSFNVHRPNVFSLTLSTLAALFLAACASSSGSSGASGSSASGETAPSSQDFCASFCGDVTKCDQTQNAQTCADSCSNELAALLPKMRGDIVTSMQQCLSAADCEHILTTNIVEGCEQVVAAGAATSPIASAFCTNWQTAAAKCDSSINQVACVNAMRVYSDATVLSAGGCLDDPCNQMTACVDAALGLTGAGQGT